VDIISMPDEAMVSKYKIARLRRYARRGAGYFPYVMWRRCARQQLLWNMAWNESGNCSFGHCHTWLFGQLAKCLFDGSGGSTVESAMSLGLN
jgi:hypothetical protein